MQLTGMNILLAEDNPTNQMVAIQMLESLGANVTLATDGAEALDLAKDREFDVGLIDIEMPRVSGTEVIRTLRAGSGPCREIPLIALTAYVMREHRLAINEAGADGVIAKPILSIEGLGADIHKLMQQRLEGQNAANGLGDVEDYPPARQPNDQAPPGIDLDAYNSLANSIDAEMLQELLRRVDADIGLAREMLAGSLQANDIWKLREATHNLISIAGIIGAVDLQNASQCLNSAAHSVQLQNIKTEGMALLDEIDQALAFVRGRIEG